MQNKKKLAIAHVMTTLENEKEMIMNGRLDNLESFVQTKISAFDALEASKTSLSYEEMSTIEEALERNQSLYIACMKGIKSGIKKIEEIKQIINSLPTYGKDGKKLLVPIEKNNISFKA